MDDLVERLRASVAQRTLGGELCFARVDDITQAAARIQSDAVELARLREALIDVGASLNAAISLLEKGGKAAKKAAPSDRMFNQMIVDYRASLERARAALGTGEGA